MLPAILRRRHLAVLAIALAPLLAAAAGNDDGLPPGLVLASSTVWDEEGRGPFTMTASNEGDAEVGTALPAPAAAPEVAVDHGTWDGELWLIRLAAGATATMTGDEA